MATVLEKDGVLVTARSVDSNDSAVQESAWAKAVHEYLSDPTLSKEERSLARLESAEDFISDLGTSTLSKLEKSKLQRAMQKLQPFLKVLTKFQGGIDVFTNADPHGVLPLVWGSIRLVLIAAKDIADLCEDLSLFFSELDDSVARLTAYESLFAHNARFSKALSVLFAELLQYFRWLRTYIRKNQRNVLRRMLHDLRQAAAARQGRIRDLCDRTEKDALFAGFEAAVMTQRDVLTLLKETRQKQETAEKFTITETERALAKEVRSLLAPVAMADALEDLQEKRLEGTCEWIMSVPQIATLLAEADIKSASTLWVTGIPGSGKTFLAAFLTEMLEIGGPTAYFFCSHANQARKDSTSILRTWIWQLLQTKRSLMPKVEEMVSGAAEVSRNTVKKALVMILQQNPRCRLVLDGIDEFDMESRAELLKMLEEMSMLADIIILSRAEADIGKAVDRIGRRVNLAKIEITLDRNGADIRHYIMHRVGQLDLDDSDLASDIASSLQHEAQSMFLYARLMLEELEMQDTDNERRAALNAMPQGVDEIYARVPANIAELRPNRRRRIHQLLQFVLCAARPITVSEVRVALAITPNQVQFDSKDIPDVLDLIAKYCRSLIEIDAKDNTLKLVHSTAREFLLSSAGGSLTVQPKIAHNYILGVCLTYLGFEERGFVERNPAAADNPGANAFEQHALLYPFLEYASVCWFYHFLDATGSRSLIQSQPALRDVAVIQGLTNDSTVALTNFLSSEVSIIKWLEIFHYFVRSGKPLAAAADDPVSKWILMCQDKMLELPLLTTLEDNATDQKKSLAEGLSSFVSHLGSYNGLGVQRWLRWRNTEGHTRPPIFIAASFDFDRFIKIALDAGTPVNVRSIMDRTPLNLAAWLESHNAIKLLIARGANVSHCPAEDGITPLLESLAPLTSPVRSPRGYYGAAHLLLEAGARVDNGLNPVHALLGGWFNTPEQYAILEAIFTRAGGADELLQKPDPRSGKNALHLAAAHNDRQLVEYLIQKHSSPKDYIDIRGGTDGKQPLHEASYSKHSEAGPPLVKAGANINGQCVESKLTPLHIAATFQSDILELFLDHGATANVQNAQGKTPLHLIAENDWTEGMDLLIKHGADVNIIDNFGETSLDTALRLRSTGAIKLLQAAGASMHHDALQVRQKYWPRAPSDAFKALFILNIISSKRLPSKVVSKIFNFAEYWVRLSSEVSISRLVNYGDDLRPYVQTAPINSHHVQPVKKVIFTISSMDQSWSHNPHEHDWSWFDAGKIIANNDDSVNTMVHGPTICSNDVSRGELEIHKTEIYAAATPQNTFSKWIWDLKNGDQVCVLPRVAFEGCTNRVQSASIEVFLACVGEVGE